MRLKTVVYSILVVLAAYFIGNYLDLFIAYEWFDMPMHFAGGFVMGLLAIWLMARAGFAGNPKWSQFLFALTFAVFVGVLWEFYEFFIDGYVTRKFGWEPMTLQDSLSDLFLDGLGGIVAYAILWKRI